MSKTHSSAIAFFGSTGFFSKATFIGNTAEVQQKGHQQTKKNLNRIEAV